MGRTVTRGLWGGEGVKGRPLWEYVYESCCGKGAVEIVEKRLWFRVIR